MKELKPVFEQMSWINKNRVYEFIEKKYSIVGEENYIISNTIESTVWFQIKQEVYRQIDPISNPMQHFFYSMRYK